MMQGAFSLAFLKRSRTHEAPTPTNISTNSEPALRDLRADRREALGPLEELHDLLEVGLGLVHAGHVVEGHARVGLHLELGLGLAEGHRVARAAHPAARRARPGPRCAGRA